MSDAAPSDVAEVSGKLNNVSYSHGPQKELYLAEEAIGLVRSLDWQVAKGPLWQEQEKEEE